MNILYVLLALVILYQVYNFIRFKKHSAGLTNYTPEQVAQKRRTDSNIVLLDVRSDMERKQNRINDSFHLPLNEIHSRITELEKFREKEIICYCESGSRSVTAAVKLREKGFNASNMLGGIGAWNTKNLR
jgi:rhodanese-related sulfurtransferase